MSPLGQPPRDRVSPLPIEQAIQLLLEAVEKLVSVPTAAELELKAFTPEQAATYLGKTENWVREAIRDGRIPHTYVGKSPRLTAAHIRWIQANGERRPNKYARPIGG